MTQPTSVNEADVGQQADEADERHIPPPSVLGLARAVLAPKSVVGSLSKEQRREMVKMAAAGSENSGSDVDL